MFVYYSAAFQIRKPVSTAVRLQKQVAGRHVRLHKITFVWVYMGIQENGHSITVI